MINCRALIHEIKDYILPWCYRVFFSPVNRHLQDREERKRKSSGILGRTNRQKENWTEGESDDGAKGEKLRDKGERTKKKTKKNDREVIWARLGSPPKTRRSGKKTAWESNKKNSAQEGWLVTAWMRNSMLKLFENRSTFHIFYIS